MSIQTQPWISVETSNQIGAILLNIGTDTFATGWAGHILKIGFWNGAVFGATWEVAHLALSILTTNLFNIDHPQASPAAKTMAKIVNFTGAVFAGLGAVMLAGTALTFGHGIILTLVSLLTYSLVAELRDCIFNPKKI
jgi:hypothetical protein